MSNTISLLRYVCMHILKLKLFIFITVFLGKTVVIQKFFYEKFSLINGCFYSFIRIKIIVVDKGIFCLHYFLMYWIFL